MKSRFHHSNGAQTWACALWVSLVVPFNYLHFSRGMAGMFMPVALQSKLSSADKVFQHKENKMRISQV